MRPRSSRAPLEQQLDRLDEVDVRARSSVEACGGSAQCTASETRRAAFGARVHVPCVDDPKRGRISCRRRAVELTGVEAVRDRQHGLVAELGRMPQQLLGRLRRVHDDRRGRRQNAAHGPELEPAVSPRGEDEPVVERPGIAEVGDPRRAGLRRDARCGPGGLERRHRGVDDIHSRTALEHRRDQTVHPPLRELLLDSEPALRSTAPTRAATGLGTRNPDHLGPLGQAPRESLVDGPPLDRIRGGAGHDDGSVAELRQIADERE